MKQGKGNRVFSRECTSHSKYPLPTTQKMTLHMDIMASYNLGNLKPYGVTKGLTQLNVKHMYGNI